MYLLEWNLLECSGSSEGAVAEEGIAPVAAVEV